MFEVKNVFENQNKNEITTFSLSINSRQEIMVEYFKLASQWHVFSEAVTAYAQQV